jgi:hypothetical protein
LGWTDGRNMRIDLRGTGDDINLIRARVQELVGLQTPARPGGARTGLALLREIGFLESRKTARIIRAPRPTGANSRPGLATALQQGTARWPGRILPHKVMVHTDNQGMNHNYEGIPPAAQPSP